MSNPRLHNFICWVLLPRVANLKLRLLVRSSRWPRAGVDSIFPFIYLLPVTQNHKNVLCIMPYSNTT